MCIVTFFFFFSSRRRHTRYWRDWSSDVCSSDLFLAAPCGDVPGCLVIDIRLPDMNGLDFQLQLTQKGIRLPVVMMTGFADISMSVRAMKRGAVDFLPKPFKDQDMLDRSEERRVGKECRSRWSPYH